MCGRIVSYVPDSEYLKISGKPYRDPLPSHNLAPTDTLPIVVLDADGDERLVKPMRWGFETTYGSKVLFNARAETVGEKPSFANAFRKSRCLVPIMGWYEWMPTGSKKVPYLIQRKDGKPAVLAGLWKEDRFTILTCSPSPELAHLHDRMPVVLFQKDWQTWLKPTTPTEMLTPLLVPFPGQVWKFDQVESWRHANQVPPHKKEFPQVLQKTA